MRFEYDPPTPIAIIADGSSLAVRDRKLATQDIYPLSQTPLRFLLSDRIDLLKDTNVVSVTADDVFISVTIEEKQALIGTSRLMLMIGAKDGQLKQWTVTDPQGYDTTVAVYNLDHVEEGRSRPVQDRFHELLGPAGLALCASVGASMPGLVPGIHVLRCQDVDGRDKPGHDGVISLLHRSHAFLPDNLEHQFGAAAHRPRRQIHQGGAAGRAVPAGDQMHRRRLSAEALSGGSAMSTSR